MPKSFEETVPVTGELNTPILEQGRIGSSGQSLTGVYQLRSGSSTADTSASMKQCRPSAIVALVTSQRVADHWPLWELVTMSTTTGSDLIPTCTVRIRALNGEVVQDAATGGDGPIDALFLAIERAIKMKVDVRDFRVRNIMRSGAGARDPRMVSPMLTSMSSSEASHFGIIEGASRCLVANQPSSRRFRLRPDAGNPRGPLS